MLQLMSIKAAEKKRRKRGDESIFNQVVVNEDRISELPEALILQILSFLPTKSAVATSVLSKQWQFLWKMVPELKFDYCDHKDEVGIFSKNVRSYLLLNTSPTLDSLHLKFHPDNSSGVKFESLIKTANARHVRKLVLDAGYTKCYRIPQSLYNNEALVTLILKGCVAVEWPIRACLKSLKTLHLDSVSITKKAWVRKLLSGCPNLEEFLMHISPLSTVKKITVAHPTLQRLSIYNKPDHRGWVHCFIDAPNMKYLRIEGNRGLRFRLSGNVTKLVKANIYDVYIFCMINDNAPGFLTSVEHLSLKVLPSKAFKIHTASIFHQLVYLELFTCRGLCWDPLIFMLDNSPKLQVLKLIYTPMWGLCIEPAAGGEWKHPQNVPECLLLLKTFVWKCDYVSLLENDKEVVKYILRNASCLKRAVLSSKHMTSADRLQLESVVRASNSCQLLFN